MPNCRYIVLSYHQTEFSQTGQLLVLLLEYSGKSESRERRSYLLSDLSQMAKGITHSSIRKWIFWRFLKSSASSQTQI